MKQINKHTIWGNAVDDMTVNFDESVKPEEYGANSNDNPNTFENDSTSAIQAAIDSGNVVTIDAGYYYITETITISSPTVILMKQGILEYQDDPTHFVYSKNHTRLYTDQDIDVFKIQSHGVYIIGGVVDTQNIPTHTKSAFKFDLDYYIYGGKIDSKVIGSEDSLKLEDSGTIALSIDALSGDSGYMSFYDIKLICQNVKNVVHAQKDEANTYSWFNSTKFDISVDGYKQVVKMLWGSRIILNGFSQSRITLTESEKEIYGFELGIKNSLIDYTLWDVYPDSEGDLYRPESYIYDSGGYNTYSGMCNRYGNVGHIHFADGILPESPAFVINPEALVISNNRFNHADSSGIISQFRNDWAYLDRRNSSVTINKYDGEGFDFDTNLDESDLPESTSISIVNEDKLFDLRSAPPRITYSEDNNDFIEVVIPYPSKITNLYYYFDFRYSAPSRMQSIIVKDGEESIVKNIYPEDIGVRNLKLFTPFESGDLDYNAGTKYIIRLIGTKVVGEEYMFLDLLAVSLTPQHSPILDIGGGQKIYGDMTFEIGGEEISISDIKTALNL